MLKKGITLSLFALLPFWVQTTLADFYSGISKMNPSENVPSVDSQTDVWVQLGRIINYFLTTTGVVMLVTLLYGGVSMLTAQGDEEKASTARKAIVIGLGGTVLTSLSYALNNWIFDSSFFVQ